MIGRLSRGGRRVAGSLAAVLVAAVGPVAGHAPAGAAPSSDDRPVVVVTTNILGDITANIAGDTADVVTLMPPGADPHSFGISASEASQMMEADLLVANGLGLEEGVLSNIDAASDAGVLLLEIGPEVDPIPFGETAGDDEGQLDPHIWTDPDRMVVATGLIADALSEIVGDDARDDVAANAEAYVEELEMLAADIDEAVVDIPEEHRRLVTNHNVFSYFAERFGFEVIGAVLPSGTTLASPSAADLADLAETISDAGVPAIFADSSQPDRLAQVLADEADVDVAIVSLYTESLGPADSGADTYLGMMRANVELMVEALAPTE